MGNTAAVRFTVLREQNSLTGKFRPDERCYDFLTVTSLVSQKLSHPCLRGTQRPDEKTLSTFPSPKKKGEFGHNDFYPVVMAAAQVTGSVDGKQALLAMICLDEIRGRLAEVFSLKSYKIDHVVHGA